MEISKVYGYQHQYYVVGILKDGENIVGLRVYDIRQSKTITMSTDEVSNALQRPKAFQNLKVEKGKLDWGGSISRYPTYYKSGKTENTDSLTVLNVFETDKQCYYKVVNADGKTAIINIGKAMEYGKEHPFTNAKIIDSDGKSPYLSGINCQLIYIRDVEKPEGTLYKGGELEITLPRYKTVTELNIGDKYGIPIKGAVNITIKPDGAGYSIRKINFGPDVVNVGFYVKSEFEQYLSGLPNVEEVEFENIVNIGVGTFEGMRNLRKVKAFGIAAIKDKAFNNTALEKLETDISVYSTIYLSAFNNTSITMQQILDLKPFAIELPVKPNSLRDLAPNIIFEPELTIHPITTVCLDQLMFNKTVKKINCLGYHTYKLPRLHSMPSVPNDLPEWRQRNIRETNEAIYNRTIVLKKVHDAREPIEISIPYMHEECCGTPDNLVAGFDSDINANVTVRPQTDREALWNRFAYKLNMVKDKTNDEGTYKLTTYEDLLWTLKSVSDDEKSTISRLLVCSLLAGDNTDIKLGCFTGSLYMAYPFTKRALESKGVYSEIYNIPGYMVLKTLNLSVIVPNTYSTVVPFFTAMLKYLNTINPDSKSHSITSYDYSRNYSRINPILVNRGRANIKAIKFDPATNLLKAISDRGRELNIEFTDNK